jgi:hypothetical protein
LIISAAKKEIMDLVQAYKKREYDEDLQYLKNFGGKYQLVGLGYSNSSLI